jgi:ABC-type Na+ efflux pump permease subunit
MTRKRIRSILAPLAVAGAVTFSTPAMCADEAEHFKYFDEATYTATIKKEMKELEAAYTTANSDKVSQGEAEKARQKAIKLSRHILRHLNTRNAAIDIEEGGSLSQTEILLNIQVQGRLLDILAAEHQPHVDRWTYTW